MQSFSDVLKNRVIKIEETYGHFIAKRSLPGEEFVFIHATPSLLMLKFPYVSSCRTDTYYSRFEQGERFEHSEDVMWLLSSKAYGAVECTLLCYDKAAIIMRMALLSVLLHLSDDADVFTRYASHWGSGFQMQCIKCCRTYVVGMGWSVKALPFLRELPKVACPACRP